MEDGPLLMLEEQRTHEPDGIARLEITGRLPLACPDCRGPLVMRGTNLTCDFCGGIGHTGCFVRNKIGVFDLTPQKDLPSEIANVRVDLVRSRKRRAFDFLVRHGFGRLAGAIKAFVRWTMLFPQTLLERLAVASLRKLDREVASDAAVAQRFADELLVGVPISRKGFLVDVGCASGRNVLLLRSLGYNVVGVDLQCYGDIWAQEADRFFCANAYALPFADKSADYVLAHAVLEHCRYDDQVIAEIRRILKDDAIAFVMVPQHTLYNRLWKRCKDRDHYREYTAEGLASLMERGGFEMVTVRRRFVYAPICMFCLNQLFGITAGLLGGARGHFRLLEWIDKFVPENERGLIYAVCQKKNLGAG